MGFDYAYGAHPWSHSALELYGRCWCVLFISCSPIHLGITWYSARTVLAVGGLRSLLTTLICNSEFEMNHLILGQFDLFREILTS